MVAGPSAIAVGLIHLGFPEEDAIMPAEECTGSGGVTLLGGNPS